MENCFLRGRGTTAYTVKVRREEKEGLRGQEYKCGECLGAVGINTGSGEGNES